jgi:CheY-like chemotaxis protein
MPRLLVIDDDADLRMAVTEYLMSLGYEVHEAAEREEAEALLEHYA